MALSVRDLELKRFALHSHFSISLTIGKMYDQYEEEDVMPDIRALVMHSQDNVATLVEEAKAGQNVRAEIGGEKQTVTATEEIPFGFKIALVEIPKGGTIIKYGELIGKASSPISRGDLVHVHNVEGTRGRGDLEKEAE